MLLKNILVQLLRQCPFLNSITDMLSSMGENEIASDFVTKSTACINSANKMSKDEAKKSIESCFENANPEKKIGIVSIRGVKIFCVIENFCI